MFRLLRFLGLLAGLALVAAACGSAGPGESVTRESSSVVDQGGASGLSGEITVSAAASLTESFTRIGRDFEATHPGTKVTFSFDSSGALAEQILNGAPADVFAAADDVSMARLTRGGAVAGGATVFARNRLAIVTKPGNPMGIGSLGDLADAGVISLCGEAAPCGRLAGRALAAAGVQLPEGSVTRGQNVKATLTAVAEGDAVAGIVYVTDARAAADRVATVAIPAADNAASSDPVAVVRGSTNPALARAFVEYVVSKPGQAVLKGFGFLPPA